MFRGLRPPFLEAFNLFEQVFVCSDTSYFILRGGSTFRVSNALPTVYVQNSLCIFLPRYHSVKGARMCDCIETMPVVSRADCTTYSSQGLVACENNDLRTHYYNEMRRPGGDIRFNLVETCDNEDER